MGQPGTENYWSTCVKPTAGDSVTSALVCSSSATYSDVHCRISGGQLSSTARGSERNRPLVTLRWADRDADAARPAAD